MDTNIRNYQDEDWQGSERIHDLARPIELEGSCDSRAFVPLAEDEEGLKEFTECRKLVACVDAKIVGFVGVSEGVVGWLYVDPKWSGKGIGRQLLREGMALLSGTIGVYVLDGNLSAKGLYESEGFQVINQFKSDNNGYPCRVLKFERQYERTNPDNRLLI